MGRPASPTVPSPAYSTRDFAPDANFPAGSDPWSGQPTKVEPPGAGSTGFVPNTGAGAQFFNKLLRDGFTQSSDGKTYAQSLRDAVYNFLVALLGWLGFLNVQNWHASVSCLVFDGNGTGGQVRAKFVTGTRTWLLAGPVGAVTPVTGLVRSTDISSFPTSNEISGGNQLSNFAGNFDADPSGNIVYPGQGNTDGGTILDYNGSAWTKRTGLFAPVMVTPDVVYEPVSALWCVAGCNQTNSRIDVYTSSNRSAWTAGTRPASQPTSNGMYVTLGTDGLGKIVMLVHDVINNKFLSSTSTDGGATWSAMVTINAAFTPANLCAYPRAVWTGSSWVAVARGATTCKVYTSPDGITWTLAATLTTKTIAGVDVDGALLGAKVATGEIAYSLDGGATWKYTDRKLSASGSLSFGAGRFITVDGTNGKAYASIATGGDVGTIT